MSYFARNLKFNLGVTFSAQKLKMFHTGLFKCGTLWCSGVAVQFWARRPTTEPPSALWITVTCELNWVRHCTAVGHVHAVWANSCRCTAEAPLPTPLAVWDVTREMNRPDCHSGAVPVLPNLQSRPLFCRCWRYGPVCPLPVPLFRHHSRIDSDVGAEAVNVAMLLIFSFSCSDTEYQMTD